MKIQLSIRREGGSTIDLGGRSYHFKPAEDDAKGPHVAEVTEPAHIERLLSIPEYSRYEEPSKGVDPDGAVTVPPPLNPDGTEQGAQNDTPVFDRGIDSFANTPNTDENSDVKKLDDALKTEHQKQADDEGGSQIGQDRREDNPPTVAMEDATEAAKDEAAANVGTQSSKDATLTGDELIEAYQEKFGRKPHHTWDEDKIREKLAEG